MILRCLFISLLFTAACSEDYSRIKKINSESIFHSNSSKIWVINKVVQKGVNYSALKLKEKDVIVFYASGKIIIQPMNTLGTFPTKTGTLELSVDNGNCLFTFPYEKWVFRPTQISPRLIKLNAKKGSDFKFNLELISYPEK